MIRPEVVEAISVKFGKLTMATTLNNEAGPTEVLLALAITLEAFIRTSPEEGRPQSMNTLQTALAALRCDIAGDWAIPTPEVVQ